MNQEISRSEDNTSIQIEIRNPKVYSTHERACRYGQVRGASPIKMLDGSQKWIALPFYAGEGKVKLYNEVA